jgi:hypothetical protein
VKLFLSALIFMLLFLSNGCASEARRERILKENPGCSMADDDELICPSPFAQDENWSEVDVD